jgi:hypothetical protein
MNFLQIYKAYAGEITDAPPNYHDFVGIAVAGIAMGNRCYLPFGDSRIYPNIWLILLGDSSYSRKTTSINIGKRLLSELCPERIYPNEFSQERIQRVLETNPAGAFFFSEFISLMGLLNRDYMSGTKGFLADLFDCPYTYRRETEKGQIKIENPAVSIISCTTQSWFIERMKESDILGGFLPRFIVVMPEKKSSSIPIPPEADRDKRRELLRELKALQGIEGVFSIDDAARKYFSDWYSTLMDFPFNHRTDAFVNRIQVYTLKFAMILNAIGGGGLSISKESVSRAVEIMWRVCQSLTRLDQDELVFGRVQQNMKKITDCLKRNGRLPKSILLKNTHLSSKEFLEASNTLTESEVIRIVKTKTATKPIEYYEIIGEIIRQ